MAETEEVVKVDIECPDCSNDYMLLEGEKMDIVNRKVRTVVSVLNAGGGCSMIPEPTQKDIEWAYRLWNGLAIGGTWTLPDVGVYVRVDQNVLALGIIHNSKPSDDAFGQSVFDRHDWIVALGELLQWNVIEQIQEAYDEDDQQIRINPDDVGNVSLCQAKCGAILRVEELVAGVQYVRISDEGHCTPAVKSKPLTRTCVVCM